jgi:transmembrane sensor
MTSQNSHQRRRDQVWKALSAVEDLPQVKAWLQEADEQFAAKQAFEERAVARSKRVGWAVAAGIALVAIGAGVLTFQHLAAQHFETHVGEQRDVLLPDGSRITLNTNTAVSVRYSKERRYLVLERGEALFSVAHDAARPFDVAAGGTLSRALATVFNVDMRSAKVTVSVLEGAVQVSTPDRSPASGPSAADGSPAPHRAEAVAKGQALEFRPKERLVVEEKANLSRIDAWRTRRLEFSNAPLVEVVEEFNRYSSTQVVLGTRDLAERRMSGVFHIGDTDGFLFSLREVLHIELHESANEIVLMQPGN